MVIQLNAFGCTRLVEVDNTLLDTKRLELIYTDPNAKLLANNAIDSTGKKKAIFEYKGDKSESRLPIFYFTKLEE